MAKARGCRTILLKGMLVMGAVVTVFLADATRLTFGHIQGASLLVFGLVLVGCVLYLPQGIKGGLDRLFRRKSTSAPIAKMAEP